MPALGPVVLGAIAVFALVLVSLVLQGRRAARARQSQRGDLGLLRVAIPDPGLTAGILSAFSEGAGAADYTLAGLERLMSGQPGTWYVAMVKASQAAVAGDADASAADAGAAMRVLLVIDGLPPAGTSGASREPVFIPGTDNLWTQRWTSGLLLVEGAPNAGDAVRDFARMKDAGAKAVAAVGQ